MIIPFFKTGKHTSRSGKILNADSNFLKKIIAATKARKYADDSFPITLGHPKNDSPAYGWVKNNAITEKDDVLFAFSEDSSLVDGVKEIIQKGLYKNVSVKLRDDNSIQHIALLGATPPAIADLPALEFNEEENCSEYEFAEFEVSKYPNVSIQNILRNIKNWFISEKDLETADKLMPEYLLNEVGNAPRVWEKRVNEFEEENNINKGDILVDKIKVGDQEFSESEIASALAAKEASDKKLAELESEKKRAEARNKALEFCESESVRDKLNPALKSKVVEALTEAELNNTTLEFSEDDKTVKSSTAEVIQELVNALPAFEFSEMLKDGSSSQTDISDDLKIGQEMADSVNS